MIRSVQMSEEVIEWLAEKGYIPKDAVHTVRITATFGRDIEIEWSGFFRPRDNNESQ